MLVAFVWCICMCKVHHLYVNKCTTYCPFAVLLLCMVMVYLQFLIWSILKWWLHLCSVIIDALISTGCIGVTCLNCCFILQLIFNELLFEVKLVNLYFFINRVLSIRRSCILASNYVKLIGHAWKHINRYQDHSCRPSTSSVIVLLALPIFFVFIVFR